MSKSIISVEEAREILGKDARDMSDEQILEVIETLDLLAQDALQEAKRKIAMKRDAKQMAELLYDIYNDKKTP